MVEYDYHDVKEHLQNLKRNFGGLFAPNREIILSRAPGRLDIMGGGIDYTGATVIQHPMQEAIIATIQKRLDRKIMIRSISYCDSGFNSLAEFNLDDFYEHNQLKSPEQVKEICFSLERKTWPCHIVGVFYVLVSEGIIQHYPHGATIGFTSTLPIHHNLSSSGALQVATLQAVNNLYNLNLDGQKLVQICQKVENDIIGVPLGSADQITPVFGAAGKLLIRSCDAAEAPRLIDIPMGYRFVGMSTTATPGIAMERHIDARIGTIMGKRIIWEALRKLTPQSLPDDISKFILCKVDLETFARLYRKILPAKMSGKIFLKEYMSDDPYTQIDPKKEYYIRSHVAHAIQENIWSSQMVKLLTDTEGDAHERMAQIGQMLYDSHTLMNRSYRLRSKNSDLIVDLIKKESLEHGFYGARATGKGGGGTVVILTREGTDDIISNLSAQVAEATGHRPGVFSNSSTGALGFNPIVTTFY